MEKYESMISSRNVVQLVLLWALGLCVFWPQPGRGQVTSNVLRRVLLIQAGDLAGTGFTIDVDGRQYLITAKHVVSGLGDQGTIRIRKDQDWTSAQVKIFRCEEPIDIAVLIPDKQLTVNFPLDPTSARAQYGQDFYFVGFPYGQLFFNKGNNSVGYYPLPFIKKATLSAEGKEQGGGVIFLDGRNNPGFSGSPIVFRDLEQAGLVFKVAGVVSGYRPELVPVVKPREIKANEEVRTIEAWRIVTLKDGRKVKLEDTEQMVPTNSGIIVGYNIFSAVDLIRKHPEGPRALDAEPKP